MAAPEILLKRIFAMVDAGSLARAERTCRAWRSAALNFAKSLWGRHAADALKDILQFSQAAQREISGAKNVLRQWDRGYDPTRDNKRLDSLYDSSRELGEYARKQLNGGNFRNFCDQKFAARSYYSAARYLKAALAGIQCVRYGFRPVCADLENYDFAIWRYRNEFSATIPEDRKILQDDKFCAADEYIRDLEARDMWKAQIGGDKIYCDSDEFFANIIENSLPKPEDGKKCDRYRASAREIFGFPSDGMMTAYRFGFVADTFGSLWEIPDNIEKYAAAFAGPVGQLTAERMLRNLLTSSSSAKRNLVMFRYSRTQVGCLAFTAYRAADRTLRHYRAADSRGRPISLGTFLHAQFPDYELACARTDPAAAAVAAYGDVVVV